MAIERKKGFLMYCDLKAQIDMLNYEEKGRLLEAIYDYECKGETKKLPSKVGIVFSGIEAQLKRDKEKYEQTCKKRAEAGKRGMAIRWGKTEDITDDNNGYQTITKITDIDKDNDKEKEKDSDIEKDNDNDNDKEKDKENDKELSEEEFMRLFYPPEKIAENERLKKESAALFKNAFGRNPTDKEKELLLCLAYGTDKDILEYAFEQAVFNDRKNLAYVQGIIKNLKNDGVTNMKEMVERDMRMGLI